MTDAISILVFLILLLSEAYLYRFSAAIQVLGRKVTDNIKDDDRVKTDRIRFGGIRRIQEHPQKFIDTMQAVTTVISVIMGVLYADRVYVHISAGLGGLIHITRLADVLAMILSCLIVSLIILVFGILLPKHIGANSPIKYALRGVGTAQRIMTLFSPVTFAVSGIVRGILALTGIHYDSELQNVTEEEIMHMVREGHEQGVLEASEARMISNIFEYGDKDAHDVMTDRGNIVAIDSQTTLREASRFILSQHYSRFPVYDKDLDHIIGILHLKDVMRMQRNEKLCHLPIGGVHNLLRKPLFIPETKKVDDILKMMQGTRTQMVIVIDEYGQTTGLVALEDILEEIVGNIQDEYDVENHFIKKNSRNVWTVDGMAPLDDLEDLLHITFDEEEDIETLNGFIIFHLEHIPRENEKFVFCYKGFEFRILSVKNRMVQKAQIKRVEEKTDQ
jgi:CBS domain containing-hemolysin-like protein